MAHLYGIRMDQKEVNHILDLHKLWLMNMPAGKRADFSATDIFNIDFSNADLRAAIFDYSICMHSNFNGADLRDASLHNVNFGGSDFRGADLRGADLNGALLGEANVDGAKISFPMVCPEQGAFVGWKKCSAAPLICSDSSNYWLSYVDVLVKLEIPSHALRSSATGRKCRASEAKVLDIIGGNTAFSKYDNDFTYRIGDTVKPKMPFDTNRWNECASGIHFFMTIEEADAY